MVVVVVVVVVLVVVVVGGWWWWWWGCRRGLASKRGKREREGARGEGARREGKSPPVFTGDTRLNEAATDWSKLGGGETRERAAREGSGAKGAEERGGNPPGPPPFWREEQGPRDQRAKRDAHTAHRGKRSEEREVGGGE